MQFLKSNKLHGLIVKCLLAVITICFLFSSCRSGVAVQYTIDPISTQEHSDQLLLQYVSSPTARKRLRLEKKNGLSSVFPVEIYKSWRIYSNRCYIVDICEQARKKLFQDSKRSVIWLQPILYEPTLTEEDLFDLTEIGDAKIPQDEKVLYLDFCAQVALKDRSNFVAIEIIRNMTNTEDKHIAKVAKDLLGFVELELAKPRPD